MRKSISFFILSSSGAPVRQFCLSRWFIRFAFLLIIGLLTGFGLLLRNNIQLRQHIADTRYLEKTIGLQQSEISDQRRQIQAFAGRFNELKDQLLALNGFEKKIRIIANLEGKGSDESLFGIGGSIPDDLDTDRPLAEKHNGLLREMHDLNAQLEQAAWKQTRGFESLLDAIEDQVNLLASTPAIRPTKGWLTSGFGYRQSPYTGLREFHKGLDIANRKGTPIIATADGVVTFVGRKGWLGKVIVVDHGHGLVTRYAHCHKLLKKRGQKVKRGETIAQIGATGRSTGPHLHYEVLLNGVPVNPTKYILN